MRKNNATRWRAWLPIAFTVWIGLAQIAPEIFQLRIDTMGTILAWLLYPKLGWILLPFLVAWLTIYLSRLEKRIDRFDQDFQVWLTNQAARIDHQFNSQFQELSKDTRGTLEATMQRLNDWYDEHDRRISAVERRQTDETG